jgi:hypothetical protein
MFHKMGKIIIVKDVLRLYCKIKCLLVISASYCMSQKTEKPVLSGQRIKTRKRGESITFLLCSCKWHILCMEYLIQPNYMFMLLSFSKYRRSLTYLTFKWPAFAYMKACKKTPLVIHFIYLGNKAFLRHAT